MGVLRWPNLTAFLEFWRESAGLAVALHNIDQKGRVTRAVFSVQYDHLELWVAVSNVEFRYKFVPDADPTGVYLFWTDVRPVDEKGFFLFETNTARIDLKHLYDEIMRRRRKVPMQWLGAKLDTPLRRFLRHTLHDRNLTRLIFQLADKPEGIKP